MNRLAVATALAFMLVTGCERASSADGADAPAGTSARTVRLGYFANLTHAQAVLGVWSDEFADALRPAKLESRVFNAGPSLIEALLAGEIDVGYVGPGPALAAHARTRGAGVRIIAGAADNGVVIVARPGSGIEKFDNLRGRKIATPQYGNTQDLSARHFLSTVLRQGDLDNVIPVANAEQLALMQRGEIDAAWVPEPWGARLMAEAGAKLIAEEKDLWPQSRFTLTVVISSPAFMARDPEAVRAILGVHRRWTARLRDAAEESAGDLGEALHALTGKRLPAATLGAALRRIEFGDEALKSSLRSMAQWAYEVGFASAPTNVEGLIDTGLLESLRESGH